MSVIINKKKLKKQKENWSFVEKKEDDYLNEKKSGTKNWERSSGEKEILNKGNWIYI